MLPLFSPPTVAATKLQPCPSRISAKPNCTSAYPAGLPSRFVNQKERASLLVSFRLPLHPREVPEYGLNLKILPVNFLGRISCSRWTIPPNLKVSPLP